MLLLIVTYLPISLSIYPSVCFPFIRLSPIHLFSTQNKLTAALKDAFHKINSCKPHAAFFKEDWPTTSDYLATVSNPINLHTIADRLSEGDYYRTKDMMLHDFVVMIDNCKRTQCVGSIPYDAAEHIERMCHDLLKDKDAAAASND